MKKRVGKVMLVTACLAFLWFLWMFLYNRYGFELFFCPIYKITGLYCPGCGTMRALECLMKLNFKCAFKYNALTVISLPFIIIALIKSIVSYIKNGKDYNVSDFWSKKQGKITAVAMCAVFVAFGVYRNLACL